MEIMIKSTLLPHSPVVEMLFFSIVFTHSMMLLMKNCPVQCEFNKELLFFCHFNPVYPNVKLPGGCVSWLDYKICNFLCLIYLFIF